ncbi:MAG: nitrous oxide reductase accessory protein NosL [Sulfurospirillum sp.]|nr:nitrous oxide reductase accessory protein NosL [Sulfurospirillum sp.]
MSTRREALGLVGKFVLVAGTINLASKSVLFANQDFRVVADKKATILQEGKAKMFCPICGMTLPMFYKTNHAADVDGKTHQYCSIHCMFEEAMLKNVPISNPQVVAVDTLLFMPASNAYYVMGSSKPATMATVSKYAFSTQQNAQAFAKEFGGEILSYEAVSQKVTTALAADIAMIQKRQAKSAKMGEKIYNQMCKNTQQRFDNPADAKVFLQESEICGKLKGKEFQQVALFLANKGM